MNLPGAFTLYRSPVGIVRVEPPDLIVVEVAGGRVRRFQRSRLRACRSLSGRAHRLEHDPTFPEADDESIVVQLQVEGEPDGLLGPFPFPDGSLLAEAIVAARDDLLLAAPGTCLRICGDPPELRINLRWGRWRIPTAELLAITVRERAPRHPRQIFPTRAWSVDAPRWLVFALFDGGPDALGPLSAPDAALVAGAFQRWRAEHPLAREPLDVGAHDLITDPARFHRRRIRASAEWDLAPERSVFAGAWLEPLPEETFSHGTRTARVIGTWIYPHARARGGFGHEQGWPGLLLAEAIELGGGRR